MDRIEILHSKLRPNFVSVPDFASILIVDDQRFDRTRLRRLIQTLDFDTHIVEADRLETMGTCLEADTFDLVLIDYYLPDGNGLQALDAVQMSAKNRNAATIMVTGDGHTDIAIEALKRGYSDYITKDDLTPEAFKRASINALQKSRLSIGLESHDTRRQQIEQVLQRFSSECAKEIKPVVSRMMRQLRDLRDAKDLSREQTTERHDKIEKSCMRLWDFLNDLDQYSGTDLAHESICKAATLADTGKDRTARDPFPVDVTSARPDQPVTPKPRRLFSKSPGGRPH